MVFWPALVLFFLTGAWQITDAGRRGTGRFWSVLLSLVLVGFIIYLDILLALGPITAREGLGRAAGIELLERHVPPGRPVAAQGAGHFFLRTGHPGVTLAPNLDPLPIDYPWDRPAWAFGLLPAAAQAHVRQAILIRALPDYWRANHITWILTPDDPDQTGDSCAWLAVHGLANLTRVAERDGWRLFHFDPAPPTRAPTTQPARAP